MKQRWLIPTLSTIALAVLLSALFLRLDLTPPLASQEGVLVDRLLKALFVLAAVVLSLVLSFLGYSLIAFRRRPGDQEDARPVYGNVPLEITWTAIPLVIVLILGGWGSSVLINISRQPTEGAVVVEVTGRQWSWQFSYPEYGFEAAELVLPVNEPALLRLRSLDVNHGFWVPEFRVKVDVIPGVVTELRITPTETGDYQVHCAELCGTAHASMLAPARVVDQATFQAWVEQRQAAAEAGGEETGAQLIRQQGCLGCHTTDGTPLVGPTFRGLYGSTRTFQDGSTAVADDAYLRNSILNPGDQVVQGYSNVMPDHYAAHLTEPQLQILIEYIKSLK